MKGGESSELPCYLLAWQKLCSLGLWHRWEQLLRGAPVGSDDPRGRLVLGGEWGGARSLAALTWALTLGLPERGSGSRPGPTSRWLCGPCKSFPISGSRLWLWAAAPPVWGVRWEAAACANEEGSLAPLGRVGRSETLGPHRVRQGWPVWDFLGRVATLGDLRAGGCRYSSSVGVWGPQMCSIFRAEG